MSALNVWGTLKSLINSDEFCIECEREVPHHYRNCPTKSRGNPLADNEKQFVFSDSEYGQSVVTVFACPEQHDPDEGQPRQVYGYTITNDRWTFGNDDIQSGCGQALDLNHGAQSLLAFLSACAEARDESSENWGMFPDNVRLWAKHFSDEIAMAAIELEEAQAESNPVMAVVDGVLTESQEDTTEF